MHKPAPNALQTSRDSEVLVPAPETAGVLMITEVPNPVRKLFGNLIGLSHIGNRGNPVESIRCAVTLARPGATTDHLSDAQ